MLKQVTANGIEHGLVNTLINQVPKSKRFKNMDAKKKEEMEKKIKDDSTIVEVRYLNHKNHENGSLYKDYYVGAGEPYYLFNFLHDHVYKVPKGLVDQVNDENRMAQKREGSIDAYGNPIGKDGPKKRIHHFVCDVS
jgi:hypothetical protein